MEIARETFDTAVVLTTSSSTTPTISFQRSVAGMVHIPSGSSITTLTWYSGYTAPATSAAAESATVFVAAQDSSGTAVTQTVAAAKSYPIPIALAGSRYLRVTGDAAGTVYITWKT